jgi:uncharacterized protein YjiS (DUF1127 family)
MPHIELELPSRDETDAPFSPVRPGALRTAALVRAHAANDAACCEAEAPLDGIEAAPDASPSAGVAFVAPSARLAQSQDVHREASRARSRMIGEALLAAMSAIARLARRARDAYHAQRRAASTRMKLGELDDRMLRDLGLDRSEIPSLGAEIGGQAERTRVHAMLASHGVWR